MSTMTYGACPAGPHRPTRLKPGLKLPAEAGTLTTVATGRAWDNVRKVRSIKRGVGQGYGLTHVVDCGPRCRSPGFSRKFMPELQPGE